MAAGGEGEMEAGGCNLLNGKNVVNIEDSLPPLLFFLAQTETLVFAKVLNLVPPIRKSPGKGKVAEPLGIDLVQFRS